MANVVPFDFAHDGERTIYAHYDGAKYGVIEVPPEAGRVVSMIEHKGHIIVACSHRVYRLVDTRLVPIRFTLEN